MFECRLTFTKVINPNIINVSAKPPYITYPPIWNDCTGDSVDEANSVIIEVTELASSTLLKSWNPK